MLKEQGEYIPVIQPVTDLVYDLCLSGDARA
jgi:hypothetical protein